MVFSELYITIIIGTVISLIFSEITGMGPSGMIIPGYMALFYDQPLAILIMFFIAFLTYIVVMKGVARVTILYGRRKFVAMIAVAIVIKLLLDMMYPIIPYDVFAVRNFSIIIPGLIANTIHKQGTTYAVVSALAGSALTYAIITLV